MKLRGISLALALALLGATAQAQTQPAGIEGKDWAQTNFAIGNGVTVKVTGTIRTINTRNGNTTRIVMIINGRTVIDTTADRAENQVTYVLSGDGPYQVQVLCLNSNADAYQCGVIAQKAGGQVFN